MCTPSMSSLCILVPLEHEHPIETVVNTFVSVTFILILEIKLMSRSTSNGVGR